MIKPPSVGFNITSNYLSLFVQIGVALILTPILVRYLGATLYGIWITIHLVVFYIKFLDLGFFNAIVKYMAENKSAGKQDETNRIVTSALYLYIFIGLIAFALCIVASLAGNYIFNIPPEHILTFQTCMLLFGVELALAFPSLVFNAILEGHQRFDIRSLISIVFQISGAIVTVVLVLFGFGIKALIISGICFTILGILVNYSVVKALFPNITIWPEYHKGSLNDVYKFSFWSFILDLFDEGGAEIDKLIIPILFPVAFLTPYSIAVTFASILILGISPVIDVFFPLSSSLDAQNNTAELRRLAINGAKAASAISLPLLIIFVMLGHQLIGLLFDAEHVEITYNLLLIISCSYFATSIFLCPISILIGMGKLKKLLLISVIEGLITLALIPILYQRLGIYSIAIGFALSNIFVNFTFILLHISNTFMLNITHFFMEVLLKPIIPAIIVGGMLSLYRHFFKIESVYTLILSCAIVLATYFTLFIYLSNTRNQRETIYRICTTQIVHILGLLRR